MRCQVVHVYNLFDLFMHKHYDLVNNFKVRWTRSKQNTQMIYHI